jgi:hypothetical protein
VGVPIVFSGTVTPVPSARWKVKIKVKVCRGGGFVDFTKLDVAVDKHHGRFSGTLAAFPAGAYDARAELYIGGVQSVRSAKRHFSTH